MSIFFPLQVLARGPHANYHLELLADLRVHLHNYKVRFDSTDGRGQFMVCTEMATATYELLVPKKMPRRALREEGMVRVHINMKFCLQDIRCFICGFEQFPLIRQSLRADYLQVYKSRIETYTMLAKDAGSWQFLQQVPTRYGCSFDGVGMLFLFCCKKYEIFVYKDVDHYVSVCLFSRKKWKMFLSAYTYNSRYWPWLNYKVPIVFVK